MDSEILDIIVREYEEQMKENIKKTLRYVNLENHEKSLTHSLSGGEKQRLAIASVLAMEPSVSSGVPWIEFQLTVTTSFG